MLVAGLFDCETGGRRRDDNHVHLQPDHLRGKFPEALRASLGISAFDEKVAAFLITEVLQTIEQRVVEFFVTLREEAHAPDLARLLCVGNERPRQREAAEKPQEVSPFHAHRTLLQTRVGPQL